MGNILLGIAIFLVVLAISIFLRHYFKYRFFKNIKFFADATPALTKWLFFIILTLGLHIAFLVSDIDSNLLLLVKAAEILLIARLLCIASNAIADYSTSLWGKTIGFRNRIKLIKLFNVLTKTAIVVLAIDILLGLWGIDIFTKGFDIINIIQQNNFTKALILLIIYLIIARLVLYLCKTYFTEVVHDTKTKFDDLILEKSEYSISWLIVCYGLKVTLKTMGYQGTIITVVNTFIVIIVALTFIAIIESLIRYVKYKTASAMNEESIQVFANISKIISILIALFTILVLWGIEIKSLLLSLGVLSVVIGFALRSTLDNMISGISMMLDQSFSVGDIVKVGENEVGEVAQIGLRSTKIKTLDHQYLIVPNAELATKTIINFAKPDPKIRVVIPAAVAYGSDTVKVEKVLRNCLKGFPHLVDPDKADVRMIKMSDFSLDYQVIFFIDNYRERFKAVHSMTNKIYAALRKNKLEIPFPTRTVYLRKGKR
ncbi:mechanosensitive ion channel [Candidatus Woesearchaeota archaeon]|nr:mechanosensitive ion channel [Candidatus Woesearchaeota archaeon]